MDGKYICYTLLRAILMAVYSIFRPFRVIGKQFIPEGPCVVCANHTSFDDPFFVAFSLPVKKHHICFMAKQELFKFKPLGWLISAVGSFPVNRGTADMEAMKNAFRVLKSGKKLGIFPEGTRTHEDGSVPPKVGAVRIASKMKVPILPMYVPRKKRWFRRNTIVIGEPMDLADKGRLSKEALEELSDDLMERIAELGKSAAA